MQRGLLFRALTGLVAAFPFSISALSCSFYFNWSNAAPKLQLRWSRNCRVPDSRPAGLGAAVGERTEAASCDRMNPYFRITSKLFGFIPNMFRTWYEHAHVSKDSVSPQLFEYSRVLRLWTLLHFKLTEFQELVNNIPSSWPDDTSERSWQKSQWLLNNFIKVWKMI